MDPTTGGMAAGLSGLSNPLLGWFQELRSIRRDRSRAERDALSAVSRALNATVAYLRDVREDPAARDRKREEELTHHWLNASVALHEVDPELAKRCDVKGRYWANPDRWDDQEITDAQIAVEQVEASLRELRARER